MRTSQENAPMSDEALRAISEERFYVAPPLWKDVPAEVLVLDGAEYTKISALARELLDARAELAEWRRSAADDVRAQVEANAQLSAALAEARAELAQLRASVEAADALASSPMLVRRYPPEHPTDTWYVTCEVCDAQMTGSAAEHDEPPHGDDCELTIYRATRLA